MRDDREREAHPEFASGTSEYLFGQASRPRKRDADIEAGGITIKVRGIDEGEHKIELEKDAKLLDYPAFTTNVRIVGTLTRSGDRFHLQGQALAKGSFECTRCADPFETTIKAPLTLDFVPPRLVKDPEDPNVHIYDPLSTAWIDITEDVRDALALAIPMKNLCRSDCKGLCANCGKNLNGGACECEDIAEIGGAWSALKSLGERLRAEEKTVDDRSSEKGGGQKRKK